MIRAWALFTIFFLVGCTDLPVINGQEASVDQGYVLDDPSDRGDVPGPELRPKPRPDRGDAAEQGAEEPLRTEEPEVKPAAAEPREPDRNAAARAECLASGGTFNKIKSGGFICARQTRDGNKACDSGRDCQGVCLARSRTCAPIAPLLGCHEILTNSGARATVCTQ